jgi:hypothetical protein
MRSVVLSFALFIMIVFSNSPAEAQDAASASPFQGTYDRAESYWLDNIQPNSKVSPRSAILYFLGNVTNTMFHEFGHALVSEFELPVLGKEEDAVDSFANITMISKDTDPILDEMIVSVSNEYFEDGKFSEPVAWDEHSMDEQRAYAVVCMLVGADPVGFKHAADNAKMPEDRQEACAYEWESTSLSWEKTLKKHYHTKEGTHSARISVKYDKPKKDYIKIEGLLKASGIIEDIAEYIELTYKIPNEISVTVKHCGEENAFWQADEHKLTFCYEIADKFLASAQAYQNEGVK